MVMAMQRNGLRRLKEEDLRTLNLQISHTSPFLIKIPDLALFSCSVESSPAANPGKLKAALVENGGQVKNVKLLAQSTGEFTRSELNKDARFKFTSLTQSVIDEWNEEHGTDPEPEP